jgi:pyroglutamyl-peptidase
MLRRRSKAQKIVTHKTPGPASASRRRARPDTPVPPALRIRVARVAPGGAVDAVVLVTGFDPFGGEQLNPSWQVCTRLPKSIAGLRVETCKIPCEFRRSIEVVAAAIERHRPSLVVCLGQAGGRAHLSVERVAINVDDARIGDNARAEPVDEPIAANGPPAYFATLPIKAMVAAMRAAGVPAEVSNTAGTYVCNHVMYGVLHFIAASGAGALDKPATAGMSIATMARGIEAAIAAAAERRTDLKVSGGALD